MARQSQRNKVSLKTQALKEIQDEVRNYELEKRQKKHASLSKESFQNNGVRLTDKQNELYKGIRNNTLTVVHGPAGTSKRESAV